jgi:kynurenine formamidase
MAHNELPPFEHKMFSTGSTPGAGSATDLYSVQYHGFSITHMDSLCHFFWEGHMYNGYSQLEVTEKGAGKLAVLNFKNGIFTRGVVMDFPRLFGAPYLKGDRRIYPEDLDAWEKNTGAKIQSGDAVLIDTGRWARYAAEGEWNASKGSAGLDATCMPWIKARNVAVLGSDLAMDAMPSNIEGVSMPVHILTLVALGAPILDNLDLAAIAKAAAEKKRWTFLLTASPLPVEGGTGSPFNPIATF